MKRSKEDVTATRALIVEKAAAEFRKNGLQVGVADLMSSAGLTHGGFYRHFESKDELIAEACQSALCSINESLESAARKHAQDSPLKAVVKKYLSTSHRDHPETGCALAGLGSELTRSTDHARRVSSEGFQRLADCIAAALPKSHAHPEETAQLIVSAMVGCMTMARIIPDRVRSSRLLETVGNQIVEKYGRAD